MFITLVCGLPGCGKTTWVQEHLTNDALVYDMDAIAAAFRLKMPHEEYHDGARRMANDMLYAWLKASEKYVNMAFVIRMAPGLDELSEISPDSVVICSTRYANRRADNPKAAIRRIVDIEGWCQSNGVSVEII